MVEKVDGNKDFISQINQQSIFKIFYKDSIEEKPSKILNGSKLAVRNDSDLFYAHENLVRGCTVNQYSTNYRLLDNKYDDFKINSLHINSSGTLLAIVGTKEITVVTVPLSITATNDPVLPVKSYRIKGIDGNVKEVLWQPIVANDCCLVVLNHKNEIKAYDISISVDVPQLTVNLEDHTQLKGESITSIKFGSDRTISGSLTLYVALSKSIYAVYPFIHKNAKLAVNKERSELFLEESTQILNNIDSAFPSKPNEVQNFGLKDTALYQYKYALSIDSALDSNLSLRKEYRKLLSNDLNVLTVVDQNLDDNLTSYLQGPLVQSESGVITNMQNIGSESDISILVASFSSEQQSTKLHYYAQLKPLIMRFKDRDASNTNLAKHSSKNSLGGNNGDFRGTPQYVKPKKGFGYIEVEDYEESLGEYDKVKNSSTNDHLKAELKYWDTQFTFLNLLAIDQITIDPHDLSLHTFGLEESMKFLISDNRKCILCDPSNWIVQLNSHEVDNNSNFDIHTSYKRVSKIQGSISSAAAVKDRILGSGEVLILLRDIKEENLELIQISKPSAFPRKHSDEIKNFILPRNDSILKKEPFEELERQLQSIKSIDPITLRSVVDSNLFTEKICSNNIRNLESMNALTIKTLSEISKLTAYALSLDSRISMELTDLHSQIEKHKNHKDIESSKIKTQENERKLTALKEKQNVIEERGQKLKSRLYGAIQKLRYSGSLPLSHAEKSWFRELNEINSQISNGHDGEKSLLSSYSELEAQVQSIINRVKAVKQSQSKADSSEKLTNLTLKRELQKLQINLQERAALLNITKSRVEQGLRKLSI